MNDFPVFSGSAAMLTFIIAAVITLWWVVSPYTIQRVGDKRRTGPAGKVDLSNFNWSHEKLPAGSVKGPFVAASKRVLDIIFASSLLFFMVPLLLVTAAAIKLESPGPVFYRQNRVGYGGVVFSIFKFRSMRQDAEKDGARWACVDDPRVTRVGAIIRKLRIDEIPQAFNVLKGEMSFVGPRPERPEFVALLAKEIPHYDERHCVKPGITGWAQVNYSYGASVDDARIKTEYDLYYIKNFTFLRDIQIILMTVRVAIFGIGAR